MVFARVTGSMDWSCPNCSSIQKTSIRAQYNSLKCGNCKKVWYHGMVFYDGKQGEKVIPRDTLMIVEGFPHKRLVNRIYCDECGTEVVSRVIAEQIKR